MKKRINRLLFSVLNRRLAAGDSGNSGFTCQRGGNFRYSLGQQIAYAP